MALLSSWSRFAWGSRHNTENFVAIELVSKSNSSPTAFPGFCQHLLTVPCTEKISERESSRRSWPLINIWCSPDIRIAPGMSRRRRSRVPAAKKEKKNLEVKKYKTLQCVSQDTEVRNVEFLMSRSTRLVLRLTPMTRFHASLSWAPITILQCTLAF